MYFNQIPIHAHKAVLSDEKTKEGKRVLIPPVYELYVEYMRLGSDNRTVCALSLIHI